MKNDFLSKFALAYQSIPSTPEEDYVGGSGKTTWRDGKLLTYDYGTSSTIYIAHYTEEMPKYDEETNEPIPGETVLSTRAIAITVPNPVTREKLLEQGRKDIYGLNNIQEQLNLTQEVLNGYMSSSESETVKTWEEITKWLNWELDVWEGVTVEKAKAHVLEEITAYDSSDAVNIFYLGPVGMWLSKEMRVGLVNSITIEQKAQEAEGVELPMTSLWYGTMKIDLPCNLALQMLSALELYALGCYNWTAKLKSDVEGMDKVCDILNFDYTIGYPEPLHFQIPE